MMTTHYIKAASKERLARLPNLITAFRFILTFMFLWILAGRLIQNPPGADSGSMPAGLYTVFALICISDMLDGAAARGLKAESPLGSILDVLADGLFIFSSLITLNIFGLLPVWFTLAVLTDFMVFLATSRFLTGMKPGILRKSFVFDVTGRIAAVLFYLIPAASCFVYSYPAYNGLLNLLLYITVFLAALSMAQRCISCFAARGHVENIRKLRRNPVDIPGKHACTPDIGKSEKFHGEPL